MSLCEAADAVASGQLSATDLVEAALARIDRLDPELHAFVRIEGDDALTRAREIDKNRGRGRVSRPARGRAARSQGHVLPGRQGFELRLPDQTRIPPGRRRPPCSTASMRPVPSTWAASPWSSSPWAPTASTPICRAAAMSGILGAFPAAHPRARARRSPAAWSTRRSAPTPAARSAARRRPTASPASTPRRAGSAVSAACRCPGRST